MKQNHKPAISVIMSVYNSEKHLVEAIESILNQTLKDFELIIINDGSKDNSSKMIKEYKGKDKRIIVINNKSNIGQTKSRNKALKIASGKYIAIMDSDDISLHKRFEIEHNYLENNRGIFLVGTGAININEEGKSTNRFKPITNKFFLEHKLAKKNEIYHPTIMFRNERIHYREKFRYSEDYDFYLSLLLDSKKLVNIKDELLCYRKSEGEVFLNKFIKEQLFAQKAREFYFQRLKYGKDLYDKFDPNEFLSIDVDNSTDKFILKCEMKASFKINNFKKCRLTCKKYFSHNGYFNNIVVYYLASFLGKNIIDSFRWIFI